MVSFFLSRVALAAGFRREHWVSSLVVGIFGQGTPAGEKELHCFFTWGCWTAPQDLVSAGRPAAFPEARERPYWLQEVLLSSLAA